MYWQQINNSSIQILSDQGYEGISCISLSSGPVISRYTSSNLGQSTLKSSRISLQYLVFASCKWPKSYESFMKFFAIWTRFFFALISKFLLPISENTFSAKSLNSISGSVGVKLIQQQLQYFYFSLWIRLSSLT